MFQSLSDSLSGVFGRLRGKGFLTEKDVDEAMRSVRVALLEADVSLKVVKEFIEQVKAKAIGEEVIKSVSPANLVIKIVQDNLTQLLGSTSAELNLNAVPPVVIMMVGLQGSGKTTSTAKLALRLSKQGKKILMASLDIYRPAAREQLAILGKQINIETLEIISDEKPLAITKRALERAKKESFDILFLDTAGRLHIDDELMDELCEVKALSKPIETLLVADSLTGQDAVNIASVFNNKVGITGIILTRIDGDARGGAALSMRYVTSCPIKFMGVGEKLHEFEPFHPERIASRILGMGDVVSLVEKAVQAIEEEDTKELEKKIRKGVFDLNDLVKQIKMLQKLGGAGNFLAMIPGLGKLKEKISSADLDDKKFKRIEAIVSSMTKKERSHPEIIKGSRKRRIALGAGVGVPEVNILLKQHKQMALMVRKLGKMDKKELMSQAARMGKGKVRF